MLLFLPSQDGSTQGLGQRRPPPWSECLLRSPDLASPGPTLSLGFNLSSTPGGRGAAQWYLR